MQVEFVVGFAIQIIGLVILGLLLVLQSRYLSRMNGRLGANDAAIFLQDRGVEDVLKEMRDLLKKAN